LAPSRTPSTDHFCTFSQPPAIARQLGSLVEVNAQQRRIALATTTELAGTEVAPLEKRG